MRRFNLMIDIGERSGSGIPSIFSVWNQNGFEEPQLIENFEPERIKLKLSFHKIGDKKSAIKIGDKQSTVKEEKQNIQIKRNFRRKTDISSSSMLSICN